MADNEIYVRLLNRDGSLNRYVLGVTFEPVSFSIDVMGGYDLAEIDVTGPTSGMFALADMLGCGIELYDRSGITVWKGLIWSAELPWGKRIIGRSLELAANTVQVAYNRPEGTVARTDFAINQRHIDRYGVKQLVGSLSDATDAQALAYRDTLLSMRGIWPAPKTVSRRGQGESVGHLVCIGLFRTLDWEYFTNAELGLNRMVDGSTNLSDVVYNDSYEGPAGVEDATIQFGDATSSSRAYFWFTCNALHPVALSKIDFKLVKIGTPTDNFIVDLVLDSAASPGTVLETITIAASTLATSHTWTSFAFKTMLVPGVVYGVQLRRSGAVSGSNYFRAASHTALGYTNGASMINNTGTWTTVSTDIFFRLESKSPPVIDIAAISARSSFAQKLTVDNATATYGIVSIKLNAAKVGAPSGDFRVQVWTDSSGSPGSLIGTATIPASAMQTTLTDVNVAFGAGQVSAVAPGTTLWIAVSETGGGISAQNYYIVKADLGSPVFTLGMKHWNGSAWVTQVNYAWMPYAVTYGVESVEQVRRIAVACGQFLSAVDVFNSSGVFVPAFASGDSTAYSLIVELLGIGTSSGGRLNATITDQGRFQIYAEPVLDDDAWYEDMAGMVRTRYGLEVPDDMTVGRWLVPQNLPGGEVPADWAHFIERTEWKTGTITRTSRDAKDALDVFGVQGR